MNTEDIKTQFVTVVSDVIDIYEKTSKFTTKDIDTLITNVVNLNKKNMLLKKVYDLEEDICKLKMLITKASLLSSVEQKEEVEKLSDSDPQQQVNEEKEDKSKKTKTKNVKKEEKAEVAESPKPVVEIEDKKEKKAKVQKKKDEPVEKPAEKPVEKPVEEEVKAKPSKKKKEEKVESPKIEEVPVENEDKQEGGLDESQQPLHIRRKRIPKQIKTLVWNEYIGHDININKCLCCKKEKIEFRNFHCGHVIAESKGGDLTIKNLRPICAPCNLSMGAMSMNEFTKTFFGWEV